MNVSELMLLAEPLSFCIYLAQGRDSQRSHMSLKRRHLQIRYFRKGDTLSSRHNEPNFYKQRDLLKVSLSHRANESLDQVM